MQASTSELYNPESLRNLHGQDFIKALLEWERNAYKALSPHDYREMVEYQFGLADVASAYPVYFAGDIAHPENKEIFVGINPGYANEKQQSNEQSYLDSRNLFEGYCEIFRDFFPRERNGLITYYAHVTGFIRRYYGIEHPINNWPWVHENLINLELVPYHSKTTKKFRIRNIEKYRMTQFDYFLKILTHLNPEKPIFINGFPTFREYFEHPVFKDIIAFKKIEGFWVGRIAGKFRFIGVPFLQQMRIKRDPFVAHVAALTSSSSIWEF